MSLSRLPVRVRLAAAFSAGLLVVLALAGTFVYIQVGNDLSDALDSSLAARADDVATIVRTSDPSKIDLGGVRAGEGESTFTQIVRPDGVALQSTLGDQRPVISREQIRQARNGTLRLDGLTVDCGSWWFNLRPSNTEPLLRLNLEAATPTECEDRVTEVLSLITS